MLESGQADELTGKAAVGDDSRLRFFWEIKEILELAWRTLNHREKMCSDQKTFVQGFKFSGVDQNALHEAILNTLEDQACLRSEDSYPVIYLRLDSHQAGSFLSSSSPEPSHKRTLSTLQRKPPHIELVCGNLSSTEQHQVNSLRIYLLKTWILNLIPPGDLTTITHEIFRPFRS
ncbi:hypothetical protein AMECASPLE_010170 [Ameca splendens]|uniref:Uncharacterized protein n=1 Tax=Ameca splendens TaxID=208324 RepID=A0ABV0ZM80_9TELE